jgi:nicotinamidase/pyrazinamidase
MKTIFWNVDTQYDFMRNDETFKGKLAIPDARAIEGNLEILTKIAKAKNLQVVNTADWHNKDTKEISEKPDFKTIFPEHCMQYAKGAEFVPATNPENPYAISWQRPKGFNQNKYRAMKNMRNIVLYKDAFDIFAGNKYTDDVLRILVPEKAVVYGVATNVCVDYAVTGLLERNVKVYAVTDAMKELPGCNLEEIFRKWEAKGAVLTKTDKLLFDLGEAK